MKNLSKFRSIGLAAVMGIVLAGFGCGRGIPEKTTEKAIEKQIGGNADVDYKADGSATIKTEDGTISTENKLPSDWATDIPEYTGATVTLSGTNFEEDDDSALILTSPDSVESVFNYYKTELANQGWKVTVANQSVYANVVQATKDVRTASVSIQSTNPGVQIIIAVTKE